MLRPVFLLRIDLRQYFAVGPALFVGGGGGMWGSCLGPLQLGDSGFMLRFFTAEGDSGSMLGALAGGGGELGLELCVELLMVDVS